MRYLSPVSGVRARGTVAEIYTQVRREFGVLGAPLVAHSPRPPLLGAVWVAARETILAGSVRREIKETAAVAVSLSNDCPYCADAHAMMLRATGAHEAAGVVRFEPAERIVDPELRRVALWASETTPAAAERGDRPFHPDQAAEVIGTIAWMHYINRIVTVFLGRRLIWAPRFGGLHALSERAGGAFLSRAVSRRLVPGESLRFIEGSAAGEAPAWAAGRPDVARVFSALDGTVGMAARESVGPAVHGWLQEEIARWDGSRAPLAKSWLSKPLSRLAVEDRSAGRVALLSAVAPWQLERGDVAEFRRSRPSDDEVLGAVALGAWTAARRVSSWL